MARCRAPACCRPAPRSSATHRGTRSRPYQYVKLLLLLLGAVVHSYSASVCSAWSRKDFNLGSRSKSSASLSASSSSSRGKLALPDVPGDGATDADADDANTGAVVQHPAIQRWGELDPKPGMVFKHQVRGRWHVLRSA